jgi:aryl-alcohol dehydrogenase-like predicted oxidoreductase
MIPMAKALNLGLVAWSPLAGGILTGKYHSGQGGDARYSTEMMRQVLPPQERQDRVVATLKQVSEESGASMAQVALAWLRYRAIPVIPIVGARNISQLENNLASFSVSLTPEQVQALDQASHIDLGFPHDFFARDMVRTFVYGGMRDDILA